MNTILSLFMATFMLFAAFWLSLVYSAIGQDNKQGQGAIVGGKMAMINREGCSEASNLCALLGGYDCKEFKRLTGESVEDFCCRTYREGCYKQKPLPDGREGVGDR